LGESVEGVERLFGAVELLHLKKSLQVLVEVHMDQSDLPEELVGVSEENDLDKITNEHDAGISLAFTESAELLQVW